MKGIVTIYREMRLLYSRSCCKSVYFIFTDVALSVQIMNALCNVILLYSHEAIVTLYRQVIIWYLIWMLFLYQYRKGNIIITCKSKEWLHEQRFKDIQYFNTFNKYSWMYYRPINVYTIFYLVHVNYSPTQTNQRKIIYI